jgi:hypothetical protein
MINLFLSTEERKRFGALSPTLTKGVTVVDETSKAYETTYELMIRANMAEFGSFPAFKKLVEDMKAGKKVDPSSLKDIPEEALPEVMFTIGARGIAVLMDELMGRIADAKDVESLAGLSSLRHDILTSNAQVLSR